MLGIIGLSALMRSWLSQVMALAALVQERLPAPQMTPPLSWRRSGSILPSSRGVWPAVKLPLRVARLRGHVDADGALLYTFELPVNAKLLICFKGHTPHDCCACFTGGSCSSGIAPSVRRLRIAASMGSRAPLQSSCGATSSHAPRRNVLTRGAWPVSNAVCRVAMHHFSHVSKCRPICGHDAFLHLTRLAVLSWQVRGITGTAEAPPEVQQQRVPSVHAREAVRAEAAAESDRAHGAQFFTAVLLSVLNPSCFDEPCEPLPSIAVACQCQSCR